jgi:hypothetical protein
LFGQPLQFLAGRRAERVVRGELIDDIDCGYWIVSR